MKKHVLFNILILSLFCSLSVFSAVMAEDSENDFRTVGSFVTFGTYPQTVEGTDDTSIEWLVLDYDAENNRALLISRYGLDGQRYNDDWSDEVHVVTWETCTLRTWLNNTFLNKAFSKEEQKAIVLSDVDNSNGQNFDWTMVGGKATFGGNNTQDKIFLLSYAEANKYFKLAWEHQLEREELMFQVEWVEHNNTQSRVAPTAYACAQGSFTSEFYNTEDGLASGWWWLRSPGRYQFYAARVDDNGSLYDYDTKYDGILVRPAFWLDLSGMSSRLAE